jgi:aldehyde:ferredoxin oxidoreductase
MMIRDHFRVLVVDLSSGRGHIEELDGRNTEAGGSGLGALLYEKYGHAQQPWNHPDQPLILAIGPLTGYFPLMSKTVCAFKSPYHDQYAESHAGGRSALALRFADLDALVVTGAARNPVCLSIGAKHLDLVDVSYMWGTDVQASGKLLRKMFGGSGHRSILRIGPAGETGSAMACINVDSYRHFGRLGSGAVMGSKNLKGIVIQGDGVFPLKETTKYSKLFSEVHKKLTATDMMMKYHSLGTASNLESLNTMQSLPWRNLKQTTDPAIEGITGQKFADDTLLRSMACSGCPVGCIHMGFVREKFRKENRYVYRQVSYDYEPIFATGSMLGVTDAFAVLNIMDVVEKVGLDVMSAGVALAWATEALERGIISEEETLVALRFGEAKAYEEAVRHLGTGANDFYRLLSQGTMKAAEHYGGSDFACVLGQEMGGYATGEVYFTAQSLGFRHSHLDTGGYSYDQKHDDKDVDKAVDFLVSDEQGRVFLTSMVACLFARGVYTDDLLADCLRAVGYHPLADNMKAVSQNIQKLRWKTRFATGFDPKGVKIPKRFTEVTTWKGPIDQVFMETLKGEYGKRLVELAKEEKVASE